MYFKDFTAAVTLIYILNIYLWAITILNLKETHFMSLKCSPAHRLKNIILATEKFIASTGFEPTTAGFKTNERISASLSPERP